MSDLPEMFKAMIAHGRDRSSPSPSDRDVAAGGPRRRRLDEAKRRRIGRAGRFGFLLVFLRALRRARFDRLSERGDEAVEDGNGGLAVGGT
jgi:hypothetical protein